MNESEHTQTQPAPQAQAPTRRAGEIRPALTIYHANLHGTGCALRLELHPAHDTKDGCIMASFASQLTVGSRAGGTATYSTFDWQHKIVVKLDFNDICQILQVLRGECEEVAEGRGLYHKSLDHSTKIVFRHMLEPIAGYSFDVYRSYANGKLPDASARIVLRPAEAGGIATAIENSIGVICFGIPKVYPHDTSAYEAALRERRDVHAA